jgi:GxxExxY protein
MKVHRSLGAGFWGCLWRSIGRNFTFRKSFKGKLPLYYDNQLLKQYRADFVCYGTIIIEIKAVSHIPETFYAQLQII